MTIFTIAIAKPDLIQYPKLCVELKVHTVRPHTYDKNRNMHIHEYVGHIHNKAFHHNE